MTMSSSDCHPPVIFMHADANTQVYMCDHLKDRGRPVNSATLDGCDRFAGSGCGCRGGRGLQRPSWTVRSGCRSSLRPRCGWHGVMRRLWVKVVSAAYPIWTVICQPVAKAPQPCTDGMRTTESRKVGSSTRPWPRANPLISGLAGYVPVKPFLFRALLARDLLEIMVSGAPPALPRHPAAGLVGDLPGSALVEVAIEIVRYRPGLMTEHFGHCPDRDAGGDEIGRAEVPQVVQLRAAHRVRRERPRRRWRSRYARLRRGANVSPGPRVV
jgi:hypothetical protein